MRKIANTNKKGIRINNKSVIENPAAFYRNQHKWASKSRQYCFDDLGEANEGEVTVYYSKCCEKVINGAHFDQINFFYDTFYSVKLKANEALVVKYHPREWVG